VVRLRLPARHGGIAAVPLNEHGHSSTQRDADGVPRCPIGLRMYQPTSSTTPTGIARNASAAPCSFPEKIRAACYHEQFAKGKGCVKDVNWEPGGRMRVLLDRDGPLYKGIYNQRTACERINSQVKGLALSAPKCAIVAL